MIRSIVWYIKFVATMIFFLPVKMPYYNRLKKKKGQKAFDEAVYGVTTKWASKRIKDSGSTVTIYHKERIPKDRNVLFVSNHQSNFDIALFMAEIPKDMGFVAKAEMERIPFLSTWMKGIHCVFLNRKDIRQSAKAISQGIQYLKEGYSLAVFPEGTRSKNGEVGEFKAGSFKLATKSGVPIVPVTIDGTLHIMDKSSLLIRPAQASMYIHEPIYMEDLDKKEIGTLAQRVRSIIVEGLHKKGKEEQMSS